VLNQRASLAGALLEYCLNLPLVDDDVLCSECRSKAQHVTQANTSAIEQILLLAITEDATRDGDFRKRQPERLVVLFKCQTHLGHAKCSPPLATSENHVIAASSSPGGRTLFAEHPTNSLDNVGLPRAVRSNDRGNSRLKDQFNRLGKALEPVQDQSLEAYEHACAYSG
jgi:hypothetical protein